jgi:glycosyltransferase involved in cell wall biosynthesis
MKVLYDINVLGNAYRSNISRTGIFRVIESLAIELNKNRDVDLFFSASNELNNINNCILFLQSNQDLVDVPFYYPIQYKSPLKFAHFIRKVHAFSGNLGKLWPIRKLFVYIEFKFLYLIDKYLIRGHITFGELSDGFDVYHTPFLALPQQNKIIRVKSEFVTIYDMLPILFPHFFSKQTIETLKAVYDSIYKKTWVLCISEKTRQDLLIYKGDLIDHVKVDVTYLAASDFFYKSNNRELNRKVLNRYAIPNNPYALALSTLDPRKNIVQIIDAFADLIDLDGIEDLNLVLVGPFGSDSKKIMMKIKNKSNLKDRIIITGFVPDEELAAIYTEAMMFVYPSFYEGFGLPPLEAMQCGVPVICSNNSSLPEVVGDAGLVLPLQIEAWAEAINQVQTLRTRYAEAATKRLENFTAEASGQALASAYRLALS